MTSPHGSALLARRDSSREPCSAQITAPFFFRRVAAHDEVLAQDVVGSAGSNTGAAECVGQHIPSQPGKLRSWHIFEHRAKRPLPSVSPVRAGNSATTMGVTIRERPEPINAER